MSTRRVPPAFGAGRRADEAVAGIARHQSRASLTNLKRGAGLAPPLGNTGILYRLQGDYEQSVAFYEKALKIAEALNFPKSACDPTTVHTLRVYPPGSTQSIEVRIPSTTACSKTSAAQLTVQSFIPAS